MRASTLFAITLSVLLGLGAVALARYAGLFDKKEPPPPVAEKQPVVTTLIATSNLYAGIAVRADEVQVKDFALTGNDKDEWRKDQNRFEARFVKPYPGAIAYRTPKQNIPAGTPLKESDFEKAEMAQSITERLEPGTSPVNVSVAKSKSVGGTIRLGEYVDVWLSSRVAQGNGKTAREAIHNACIAKDCKVVMKRNMIFSLMAVDPDDKPVHFTLQTNPYRAALIEYALNRGEISLRPVPPPAAKATGSFVNLGSPEYADEDNRVDLIKRGMYTMGDSDLMRIFNLKPLPPVPVVPPPPPPIQTLIYQGTDLAGRALYEPSGKGYYQGPPQGGAAAGQPQQAPTYSFGAPSGKGRQGAVECEDCENKK